MSSDEVVAQLEDSNMRNYYNHKATRRTKALNCEDIRLLSRLIRDHQEGTGVLRGVA